MEHGKPIVYVCPPAGWAIRPLFEALPQTDGPGLETLILAPEAGDVLDAAAALGAARPKGMVHPLTGLARTERLIRADHVSTLVATPADALYLLRRSALKSEKLSRVAVLWPEMIFATEASADLDTVLGDAAGAQRIIVTIDDNSVVDFVERHARRAPIAVLSGIPERGVYRNSRDCTTEHLRASSWSKAVKAPMHCHSRVMEYHRALIREAIAVKDQPCHSQAMASTHRLGALCTLPGSPDRPE